jgi:uncharacterized membrane protein YbhN (UPF0104 family)
VPPPVVTRVDERCSGFAWNDAEARLPGVSLHVTSRRSRRVSSDPAATLPALDRTARLKESGVRADEHSADSMRTHLAKRHVALAVVSLVLLAVLCASPSLFGNRVAAAWSGLDSADPRLLWIAGIAFAGMALCGALSWRAALRASGTPLTVADASGRYLVGCGVNAIAPAHIGSAVRVALFARVTRGGCWTVGGAAAAVGVTRIVWLGALIAIGSAGGVLPAWPLAVIGLIVAGAAILGLVSRRVELPPKVEQLLAAFRSLAASPKDLAIVMGWALAGAAAKVAAATAVVSAVGVDHPVRAALVLVPAVELAAILPITPGNVGLASAAVALALGAQGVDQRTALSAGIAFGALELITGLVVGAAGALTLAGPSARPFLRVAAVGAAAAVVAVAFGATVVLPAV